MNLTTWGGEKMDLVLMILGLFAFCSMIGAAQLFLTGLQQEKKGKNPATLNFQLIFLKDGAIESYKNAFLYIFFTMLLSNLSIWLFYKM